MLRNPRAYSLTTKTITQGYFKSEGWFDTSEIEWRLDLERDERWFKGVDDVLVFEDYGRLVKIK